MFCGCPYAATFSAGYDAERHAEPRPPVPATLAVRRFRDERPPREYSTQGRLFLTYVPLIPYVSLPFERMDENARDLGEEVRQAGGTTVAIGRMPAAPEYSKYAYVDSMPRAIADDLRKQDLFREVTYVGDAQDASATYVLDGVLRATPLTETATSYGLGAAGVLLWLLPIPVGKSSGSVDLTLTLTDQASGDVVWTRDLHAEISRIFLLYTSQGILYGTTPYSYQNVMPPDDVRVDRRSLFSWHFEALRRAMAEATPELAAALPAR